MYLWERIVLRVRLQKNQILAFICMTLYISKFKGIALALLLIGVPGVGMAKIVRSENIMDFQELTQEAGPHSLVIFDINETLLLAQDEIFQSLHKYQRLALLYELEETYSKEVVKQFWAYLRLKTHRDLIDPRAVGLIQNLQAKNIKVIALTTSGMGLLNESLCLEDWKLKILKGFGIDFSQAFPERSSLKFHYLLTKHPSRYPGFKNGIIFTCGLSKGLVLSLVLKKLDYKPEAIFFVDDKLKNLLSVEEVCKKLNIPFVGCHYTAFSQKVLEPLDKKKIYRELEAFLKQGDIAH